tara:strand:+ start:326 stop:1159 length:834 start_codon:yes stop_codon:yes gene_type:complete
MFNKIVKSVITIFVVTLIFDLSYGLKLPGGLGSKKSKKAAKTAIAYNLVAPEYDKDLAMYGVIGSFDLGIAGAPVCQKVMQCQINLALSNKGAHKALDYLTDALANKDTKAKIVALQKELKKEKKVEKKQVKMQEIQDLQMATFDGVDEKKELSKEQAELLTKASFVTAGTWYFLATAGKDAAELPALIKEGIDEVKDAIDDAKSGGLSGMKAVAGLTGNLKGIKAAAGLPKQFIESGKLQSTIFKKIGKMLKNNKYESPSLEDASKSDKAFNPSED